MRQPLADNIVAQKAGRSRTTNVSAPVGGWNTRDSLVEMAPEDATVLDNWMVRNGECQLRGGSEKFAWNMLNNVKSVFQYSPPDNTKDKIFCATDDGIFDITAGGLMNLPAVAVTNGYINGVHFTNSAGTNYWWGLNGVDGAKVFDGTTWSTITAAITGATVTNCINPWLFKHRIFMIQKDSLDFWYLGLDSIQGEARRFPMGNFFRRGGRLVAGANWTLDAGDGADDLCVMVTSEGELAVYKGIDIDSASNWSLVGIYYVGRPLGARCFVKFAGDLGILVDSGFYLLSNILKSGRINFASALSNKIQPTFTSAVREAGIVEGWEAVVFPQYDAVIVNVPMPEAARQFVMNTVTGAWSSFSGWNASCFLVGPSQLYFGKRDVGQIYRAWDGALVADEGADIVTTTHQAWSYLGARTMLKRVDLFRLLTAYDGSVEFTCGISPDYTQITPASLTPRQEGYVGSAWDTAEWDVAIWTQVPYRHKTWRAARHFPGYALALWLQTASKDSTIAWSGTDYIFSPAGAI